MRLKVLVPSEILVDQQVKKVRAEAQNGSFGLLPRHVDFVAALVPGLLSYTSLDDQVGYVAIDEGILVKCGPEVLVSTQNAIAGHDLGHLREMVEKQSRGLDERERMTRMALTRLEADFVRRFIEL